MKRVIHSGIYRIEILKWHECGPDESILEFHDPTSASSFLSMFISDHFNVMILRDALAENPLCADLCRSTDNDVCRELACQIARGYIRLVPRVDKIPYALLGGEPEEAEAEAVEAPAPEAAAATTVAPTTAPPIPTEVSEPEVEVEPEVEELPVEEEPLVPAGAEAAQAATMVKAAESGAPFCDTWPTEESPREGLQEPEEELLVPIGAAAAQAATMVKAAESGAAFCDTWPTEESPREGQHEPEEELLVPAGAAAAQAATMVKATDSGAAFCDTWPTEESPRGGLT